MRIGVDIRGLLTGQHSGVEQYTLQVLEHLLKIDRDNIYVLFYVAYRDLDAKLGQLLSEATFLRSPNVEIRQLKWVNLPLLLHALWKPLGWPLADKVCGGLDVMWQPSPRLLPVSRRCRTVITFHDLVFARFPQFYTWESRLWQWQMSYPYLARTASKIIAVSESTKNDLVNLYRADPAKISVVYEGVAPIYFIPKGTETINALRVKFQVADKYLYYLGSLEPRKNVIAIVRSLHYIKQQGFANIKLVISGAKSWLSEAIFAEVEKLNLGSDVIFTGPVTEAEKIAWLQNATAFIFPTFYEGFGLPVLEAMAAGCPVITSNVASLPEVTGSAAMLVNPYQQSELNSALQRLLMDPGLLRGLVASGQERARQFTWEKTATATLKILMDGGLPR